MHSQGHRWQPGSYPSGGGGGPVAPVCVTNPTLTTDGTPQTGETISTNNGFWVGTAPFAYSYQWQRNGANIGGATANTRLLAGADEGQSIRCVVTNTNVAGAVSANSNAVVPGAAPPPPPASTGAPVVTGSGLVGGLLSTTNGTWSNAPTSFAYQWQKDGVNIGAATASTYTTVSGDAGHNIRCVVTAMNTGGSGSANSNAITISVPASTALYDAIIADAPIAYYRKAPAVPGNDIVDATGQMNLSCFTPHGTYVADAPSLIDTNTSDPGMAFFDGNNCWSGNTPMETHFRRTRISIVCWVRPSEIGGVYRDIVVKGPFYGMIMEASAVIRAHIQMGGVQTTVFSTTAMAVGTKRFLAMTHDGANLKLYVDGAQEATIGAVGNIDIGTANFVLAAFGAAANGFDGVLDEVAIFDKGLSAARILAYHQAATS